MPNIVLDDNIAGLVAELAIELVAKESKRIS